MIAGLDADYDAIAEHCEAVLEQVAGAETVRITTPAGTNVTDNSIAPSRMMITMTNHSLWKICVGAPAT